MLNITHLMPMWGKAIQHMSCTWYSVWWKLRGLRWWPKKVSHSAHWTIIWFSHEQTHTHTPDYFVY